jgi:predicted nucleotidyltransferase
MAKKKEASEYTQRDCGYCYCSPNIPLSAIRRVARQLAEWFQPEKIILFGSYAYGQPHDWSDVDLLVIVPASKHRAKALRIASSYQTPFCLDLVVRTPRQVEQGLKDENWFLTEIVTKGKVLYEKGNGALGPKSRGGSRRRQNPARHKAANARSDLFPLPTVLRSISRRSFKNGDCQRLRAPTI